MTLHTIIFALNTAQCYRRDGATSAPPARVRRADLPGAQQAQWDTTTAALAGLLAEGESVLGTEIAPAPPAPVAFAPVTLEGGVSHEQPTAWRDTLHVVIRIRTADGLGISGNTYIRAQKFS